MAWRGFYQIRYPNVHVSTVEDFLYRTLELPGKNPLRDAHDALDAAVRDAYGMKPKEDVLAFLLALNGAVAAREAAGQPVTAPGLPPCVTDPAPFITDDCIQPPPV